MPNDTLLLRQGEQLARVQTSLGPSPISEYLSNFSPAIHRGNLPKRTLYRVRSRVETRGIAIR